MHARSNDFTQKIMVAILAHPIARPSQTIKSYMARFGTSVLLDIYYFLKKKTSEPPALHACYVGGSRTVF